MSRIKPISNIRSASSNTKISTPDKSTAFWLARSNNRPGVATKISSGFLSLEICGLIFTPPKMTVDVSVKYLPYVLTDSSICAANSRVGVSIRQRGRPLPKSDACFWLNRCKIGNVKPAVLPVPVCAPAIRSPPLSTCGMALAWIGVGVV